MCARIAPCATALCVLCCALAYTYRVGIGCAYCLYYIGSDNYTASLREPQRWRNFGHGKGRVNGNVHVRGIK